MLNKFRLDPVTWSIGLLFYIFFVAAMFYCATANAGTFYQWTDANGVVHFVDATDKVPAKAESEAKEMDFKDLEREFTPLLVPSETRTSQAEDRLSQSKLTLDSPTPTNPNHSQSCTGPLTIEKIRQDYKERGQKLNSMFFVTRDSCGEVVSITREQPFPTLGLQR